MHEKVSQLRKLKQFEQLTTEWLDARYDCISASDIASAIPQSEIACRTYIELFKNYPNFEFEINPKQSCNVYSSTKELIKKKVNKSYSFEGNIYTRHGQKYEPVIATIYSQLKQVEIINFGLLLHPQYSFLGASPDGITTEGTMIEIKCPARRKVKPYPSLHYYLQVLLQLECASLDKCDFIDAQFIEYIDAEVWKQEALEWEEENLENHLQHHVYGILLSMSESEHLYAPSTIYKVSDFISWKESNINSNLNVIYYKLQEYHICEIKADKTWLPNNLTTIESVWNQILNMRKHIENPIKNKTFHKTIKKNLLTYTIPLFSDTTN